ncbi:MAG: ABC transporter, permease protein (cluster 2, ribose/xylose/arabinose/galactose), partial [uncultured Thermomicrobiales bacterium]
MSQSTQQREPTPPTMDQSDERLASRSGLSGAWHDFLDRLRSGDLGTLPVIAGLVVIFSVMYFLNDNFLSPTNLVNLTLQASDTGVIALGIVVVLLVGQIDLSVGSVSGVSAAITAITFVQLGWPLAASIGAAVASGCLIGWVYSIMFNRFGVPSFVISLAGLLGFLGVQLYILSPYGRAVNIPFDSGLVQFASILFLPHWASYVLVVVLAGGYLAAGLARARERRAANLSAGSLTGLLVRAGLLAVALAVGVFVLNQARGVSYMFVLFVGLVLIMHYMLSRTRWGRSLYAVGGNVEAARRAGINVRAVYASAFVACSGLAALGGVLAAARLTSASTTTGTGDVN